MPTVSDLARSILNKENQRVFRESDDRRLFWELVRTVDPEAAEDTPKETAVRTLSKAVHDLVSERDRLRSRVDAPDLITEVPEAWARLAEATNLIEKQAAEIAALKGQIAEKESLRDTSEVHVGEEDGTRLTDLLDPKEHARKQGEIVWEGIIKVKPSGSTQRDGK